MTGGTLSAAVRSFLTEKLGSVERLNVLLFVHRHATKWWGAETLASELDMPVDSVQSHLEQLSTLNLLDVRIAESVIYCYEPGREELSRLVDEVARAHYLHRDAVVGVLARKPAESARLFAEAFQFRKGRRDG